MIKVGNTRRFGSIGARSLMPGAAAPPIVCAYPLDASLAEVQAVGLTGKLSMDATQQIGTRVLKGGLASPEFDGALPSGFPGSAATLDLSAGNVAIQARLIAPTMTGGSGHNQMVESDVLYVSAADGSTRVKLSLYAYDDGTFAMQVNDAAGISYGPTAVASGNVLTTVEFSSATGTYAVRVDGTLLTLATNAYAPGAAIAVEQVGEQPGVAVADTGKIGSVQLITSAADMTGPITAGFTDQCGNATP